MGRVIHQVSKKDDSGYDLFFQYYDFGDNVGKGYRFIWRDLSGKYTPQNRGRTKLPNILCIQELIGRAIEAGWGTYGLDKFV